MPNVVLCVAVAAVAAQAPAEIAPGAEAIVYNYRAEAERKDTISAHPVAASLSEFPEMEKGADARDAAALKAMERRGALLWVLSGTRCRVVERLRAGATIGSDLRRDIARIELLNGDHKGKEGWIASVLLRKRPKITIDPPEPLDDENRDSPRLLALMLQAQDRVIYREIRAADRKATAAARTLPKTSAKRRARYDQVFRRELRPILDRYGLDEPTAHRILDWGQKGDWPADPPEPEKKAGA